MIFQWGAICMWCMLCVTCSAKVVLPVPGALQTPHLNGSSTPLHNSTDRRASANDTSGTQACIRIVMKRTIVWPSGSPFLCLEVIKML